MVLLDLFPAGIMQLKAVLDNGLWFARSQAFIAAIPFQTATWMRALGGYLFLLGGVIPLSAFMLYSCRHVKQGQGLKASPEILTSEVAEQYVASPAVLPRTSE